MTYLLNNIPEKLWIRAKHIAVDESTTMRALLLKSLRMYVEKTPLLHESQDDMEIDMRKAKKEAKEALDAMKQ